MVVSTVGHPLLILPLAIGFVLNDSGASAAWLPLSLVLLSLLVVAAFVVRAKAKDQISDLDVSRREQRPRLYLLSISAVAVSAVLMWRFGQPPQVWQGALVAMGLLLASAMVNQLGLKASLHTSFGVYAAGVLATTNLTLGLLGLALAALVGWSRVVLGRHSWPEVAAGLMLGLVSAAALRGVPFGAAG